MTADLSAALQRAMGEGYLVERELAGGGMSRVFLATETALRRPVVVKVLPPELASGVSMERFTREIAIAAQLAHPHIVGVLTAGTSDQFAYYTMPFVAGRSLRDRLADGRLPIGDTLKVLRDVAEALAFAHEHGVVHRDIKPDNVLLAGASPGGSVGTAMVTDFGVSKALSVSATDHPVATLTAAGVALGTPAYMAPEQVAAEDDVDHRVDIYAFGVMAYELLTGSAPFAGRSQSATLAAHVLETATPVATVRPGVPPALAALVGRCLAKSRDDRPSSAAAIVVEIDQIISNNPTSAGLRPQVQGPGWSERSRRPRLLVVGALLLGAAIATWRWTDLRRATTAGGTGAEKAIAVLPLANVGDSSNAYFAAGMTDEIASTLGKIPGLRVASRTSTRAFANRANMTVKEIGRALHVDVVLEGSVRRSGDRVRVQATLVNVASGASLWSDSFDAQMADVFQLQDSVAISIGNRMEITLGTAAGAAVANHGTRSTAAQDLVWQAQFVGTRVSDKAQRSAIALYDSALVLDPRFADAWAGKAYAWFIMADDFLPPNEAYPQAEAAVKRALELDPTSATAHTNFGLIEWWYRFDADAGEREVLSALQRSPQNVGAIVNYGTLLGHTHRNAAAIDQLQRAFRLDSLSSNTNNQLALGYLYAGRFEEALAQAKHTSDRFPATGTATLGKAYRALHRYDEAISAFRKANELGYRTARGEEGITLAMAGRLAEALAIARELERERRTRYVAADLIGRIYLCAAELETGFRWLDIAFAERSGYLMQLEVKQEYEPFRKDSRFIALQERVRAAAGTVPRTRS